MMNPTDSMDQTHFVKMPLVEALRNYRDGLPARFHIPGHFASEQSSLLQSLFGQALGFDVTEVDGLDDLHQPEACIAEAQALAAQFFGAAHSFFLVQGSTVGNLAMILSVCQPGDIILMQRNVHQSLIHAAMLAQVQIQWIWPSIDAESGIATGIDADLFAKACENEVRQLREKYNRPVRAMVLCRPNYYGHAISLQEVVEAAHRVGLYVLVDEAHGAHFGLHSDLPQSALASGADLVVQSTHKMGGALTMGAMLHLRNVKPTYHFIDSNAQPEQISFAIDPYTVQRVLRMIQTSSPSYLIMASLDAVRAEWQMRGERAFQQSLEQLHAFRERIQQEMKNVSIRSLSEKINPGIAQDPYKIVIYDRSLRLNGYELKSYYEQEKQIPEMADAQHVVFVCSWLTDAKSLQRLFEACQRMDQIIEALPTKTVVPFEMEHPLPIHHELQTFSLTDLIQPNPVRLIPLVQALGFKSSEWIVPYPPGVPYAFPGERITSHTIGILQKMSAQGATIKGLYKDQHTDQPYVRVYE